MSLSRTSYHDRPVALWLLLCAAVIFCMILLGGVTRLTHSGLSMVEWKPLMGVVPPLSEEAWQETFDKYKQFPEYRKVNRGMDLSGFKYIFMYEYLHRLLGRIIGVLFLLPMLFFAFKGWVRPGIMPKLWLLFCMGGMQGLLGWFMVKSGLVDDPRVSHFRLTAHLGVAVAIYAVMLWVAFDLLFPRGRQRHPLAGWALALTVVIYLMILTGGLVAGTHAGFAYNTWPLMGTSFFPPGLYATNPAWRAAFEDIATIQFNHRMLAYLIFLLVHLLVWRCWRRGLPGRGRVAVILLLAAVWLQVTLGISTLLMHVPVGLAASHQGGAILLLTAALYASHTLTYGGGE